MNVFGDTLILLATTGLAILFRLVACSLVRARPGLDIITAGMLVIAASALVDSTNAFFYDWMNARGLVSLIEGVSYGGYATGLVIEAIGFYHLLKLLGALDEEVSTRKSVEKRLNVSLDRSRTFNQSLEMLFEFCTNEGKSSQLFSTVVKTVADALNIERCSIWRISEAGDEIECIDLFDRTLGGHYSGTRLSVSEFPIFLSSMRNSRVVDASDAHADPRTLEFSDSYLKPRGIQSVLAAQIPSAAGVHGVIACEAIAEKRFWTPDEISFTAATAQILGLHFCAEAASELNDTLRKALEEAQHASATKSQFLANMSHEIRTPMNGVLGAASLLLAGKLDEQQRSYINIIYDSGQSLLNVLNDILDLSKIEAGHMTIENIPFDLTQTIEKVAAVHSLKAQDNGVAFRVDCSGLKPGKRVGDPTRIGQALHNVMSNAVKFTAQGHIDVVARDHADPSTVKQAYTEIVITDTGVGMTPEQTGQIFDAFSQADASTTRKYGGSGLGLSVTRQLLTLMQGEIEVDSTPGEGSAFRLRLPLIQDAPDQTAEALASDGEFADLNAQRILVAEDNPTNQIVVQAMIKQLGLSVSLAADGSEAVAKFKSGAYDAVLMDIQMPVMDGVSALLEIRRIEQEQQRTPTPIIALTAHAMRDQVAEYTKLGFDGFISKPIDLGALRSTLLESVESWREPDALNYMI